MSETTASAEPENWWDCTCVEFCNRPHCSDRNREPHIHGDEDDCPVHGRPGSAR